MTAIYWSGVVTGERMGHSTAATERKPLARRFGRGTPVTIVAVLIAALSAFSALGYGEGLEASDGGTAHVAAAPAPRAGAGVPVAVVIHAPHPRRRGPAGIPRPSFALS